MKDKKREEIKKHADIILKQLSSGNSLLLDIFNSSKPFVSKWESSIYDVVDYLETHKYITVYRGPDQGAIHSEDGSWVQEGNDIEKITITELGLTVKDDGGIIQTENKVRNEKKRKKWLDIIGICGGIVGFLTAFFGVLIYFGIIPLNFQLDETTTKLNSLKNEIQSIEDRQKELDREYVRQIDSLYLEINKLKKNKNE